MTPPKSLPGRFKWPEMVFGRLPSRRLWLRQTAWVGLAAFSHSERGQGQEPAAATEIEGAPEEVQARAKKAGLPPLRVQSGDRYVAIGNASEQFQQTAIGLCEGLAVDFVTHFSERKFSIQKLARKLPLVILANPKDFAAFLGVPDEPGTVAGIYEVRSGWLVVRDHRGKQANQGERANSIALFHEATHQLSYETRLLHSEANIPLAIVEGLGTYGEVRRPDGRTRVGALNHERLQVLGAAARDGLSLFTLGELVNDDELFELPRTEQLAYAQAWALIHLLMQPAWTPKFQAYLEKVNTRRDARSRLADFQDALGPLATLDAELKKHVNRLMRKS